MKSWRERRRERDRGVVDLRGDAVVADQDRARGDRDGDERLRAVAELELDVGERDADVAGVVLIERERAAERLAEHVELHAAAADRDLLGGGGARVEGDGEQAAHAHARDVDARPRRRSSPCTPPVSIVSVPVPPETTTKSRAALPRRRPKFAIVIVGDRAGLLEREVGGQLLAGDRQLQPGDRRLQVGTRGQLQARRRAAEDELLVDRRERRVQRERDLDRRHRDAAAEVQRGAGRELAGHARGRDQEAARAAGDREAGDAVRRAQEHGHVGGLDAQDRRVVGGVEDLVGAGAGHALEHERAAELLAEDLDLVGARGRQLHAQAARRDLELELDRRQLRAASSRSRPASRRPTARRSRPPA